MNSYAVLLRGINVGRNNRIAMADLRALLTGLGYDDVATLLQSGNAVFRTGGGDPAALAIEIERAIKADLGLSIPCLVRDRADLDRIVADNPLAERTDEPSKLLVCFLAERPDPSRLAAIDFTAYAPEECGVGERELYVWYPGGQQNAKLTYAFFEKRLGGVATARNWNTVTKLLAMMD
ncbi:uncharacterized protein (DUF1697 family) [Micromonospora pisi]|uniref:Uncharacterized protein (DUF1697 family) n=1 Tax=Micromonospora pisi TaxID=589240 RepID=A0A495JJD2_9ACTN|nr:DUF1697 domain-containing protein [Micromonospora pisi]RKR88678.1 uncharacterized protein (DUF1697 family) [Micromonospora pisi]